MGIAIKVPNVDWSGLGLGNINYDESYEEETLAYLNVVNITDSDVIERLNTLVIGIKELGIWDKIYALYPILGSTFADMSVNLKNPTSVKLSHYGTGSPTIVQNKSLSFAGNDCLLTGLYLNGSSQVLNSYHFMMLQDNGSTSKSFNHMICTTLSGGGVGMFNTVNSNVMEFRGTSSTNSIKFPATLMTTAPKCAKIVSVTTSSGFAASNGIKYTASESTWTQINAKPSDQVVIGMTQNPTASSATMNIEQPIYLAGFGSYLSENELLAYSELLDNFKTIP